MKTDLYTSIHKAQRLQLFSLSIEIGRADFSDPDQARRIAAETRAVAAHLRDHAAIEEAYIHPAYRRLGAAAADLERDHRDLEADLEKLEALAEAADPRLHRAYNAFLGRYLTHLEEEESAQEEILWTRCDENELAEIFARFMRERPPAAAREDFEYMLPALNVPELIRIFTGMKARAPAPVFESACALAARRVEPARWERVIAALP